MVDTLIPAQYSTGDLRRRIEDALVAAGKNPPDLQPTDLALLEDFHTLGRYATSQLADLADLAGLGPDTEVLDSGSGIGGTARYIADRFGSRVTAVDLTGTTATRPSGSIASLGSRTGSPFTRAMSPNSRSPMPRTTWRSASTYR